MTQLNLNPKFWEGQKVKTPHGLMTIAQARQSPRGWEYEFMVEQPRRVPPYRLIHFYESELLHLNDQTQPSNLDNLDDWDIWDNLADWAGAGIIGLYTPPTVTEMSKGIAHVR